MADRFQQRRDTAARWAEVNPILMEGETGYVLDDPNIYKMGDGVSRWNDLLPRGYDGTLVQSTGTAINTVMSQKAVTDSLNLLKTETDNRISPIEAKFEYTNRLYPIIIEHEDIPNRLVSNDGIAVTDINSTTENGWYTSNAVPVRAGEWYKLTADVFKKYQIAICFLKSDRINDYCSNKGVAFDTKINIDNTIVEFNFTGEFKTPDDCTHIVYNTGHEWKKFNCVLYQWDGNLHGVGPSYKALIKKYIPYFQPIEDSVNTLNLRFIQSNRIYPDSNIIPYTEVTNQLVVNNGTTITSVDKTDANSWKTTNNIPVVPGEWYKLTAKKFVAYNIAIAFLKTDNIKDLSDYKGVAYNSDVNIDGYKQKFNITGEFQIPSDTHYITYNTSTQGDDFGCVLKKWDGTSNGTGGSKLVLNPIYVQSSNDEPIDNKLNLSDLTWAAIGDSTTALDAVPNPWAGQTFGYQTFVKRYITFKDVPNYGYGGYTLGKTSSTGCIFDNKDQWGRADIYTIMAGINDALTSTPVPVGLESDYDNKTGLGTYYGALREYIDYIYSINASACIFLIAQYAFVNVESNHYYWEYMKAIRYVSEKYGIPMIDLYSQSGINQYNKGVFLYDGTHPNDKGYTLIGRCIKNRFIEYFK